MFEFLIEVQTSSICSLSDLGCYDPQQIQLLRLWIPLITQPFHQSMHCNVSNVTKHQTKRNQIESHNFQSRAKSPILVRINILGQSTSRRNIKECPYSIKIAIQEKIVKSDWNGPKLLKLWMLLKLLRSVQVWFLRISR